MVLIGIIGFTLTPLGATQMQDEAYQKEYAEAMAKLEAGASVDDTTPRNQDGTFAKAEEPEAQAKSEATPVEPAAEAKPEVTPEPDPLAEIRAKLEKTEKALKDTQAWGTQNAQRLAAIERERQQQQREANKPAILDANPDLADAIRFVAGDPAPQQQQIDHQQQWQAIVDAAHPGIFALPDDDELVKSVLARRESIGEAWNDPLVAIREITAEKLAHTERQLGKRFAAESAKLAQKSAMSVPGAGSSSVVKATVDADLEERNRILKMSDADFAKEVRRVKGY